MTVKSAWYCLNITTYSSKGTYQFQHGADGQADTHNQTENCAYAGIPYHLEGCLVQETEKSVARFRDVVLLLIAVFQLVPDVGSPCEGQQCQNQPYRYTIANPR